MQFQITNSECAYNFFCVKLPGGGGGLPYKNDVGARRKF